LYFSIRPNYYPQHQQPECQKDNPLCREQYCSFILTTLYAKSNITLIFVGTLVSALWVIFQLYCKNTIWHSSFRRSDLEPNFCHDDQECVVFPGYSLGPVKIGCLVLLQMAESITYYYITQFKSKFNPSLPSLYL
jgi:hypothetical protein